MAAAFSVTLAPLAPPADRTEQIQRVAQQIEGLFLKEILKVMRDSVPESGMLQGGMAGDIYGDMFDQEISTRAGSTGGLGLADLIAEQLGAGATAPSIAPSAPQLALARYRNAAGRWVHPLPDGPALPESVGGRFGATRSGSRTHMGVDLRAPTGTPVRAVSDGTIERVERDGDSGRAGRYLRIAHPGGIVTRYIHLDEVRGDLAPGDHVASGELIGTVGKTGVRHSAPHLHFTVSRRDGGPGASESYIDPTAWLDTWRRGISTTPANVGPAFDEGRTKGGPQ